MLVDVFKIVVWLVERYDLHEQVKEHFTDMKKEEMEAVMVEPKKPYLIHFNEPFQTSADLKNKMIECTNLSEGDQRNQ